MSKSAYTAYNATMLNHIAGDQHRAWLKAERQRKLKLAKKSSAPLKGVTLSALSALKGV